MKEVRFLSIGIQNNILHWFIFKMWNYRVSRCLKYNYFKYTKVFGNRVQSFIEIMRNHVISYGVIEYELKLDRFILKENK